jgi:hypothetical protein
MSNPSNAVGPTRPAAPPVGEWRQPPAPRYGQGAVTMKDFSIQLEGVDALDLPLSVLRDLCDLFVEGAQRSARLVAEGRSVARGATPAWATAAADLRVSKFERGSLNLGVRANRLVDVAPDIFAQQQLFPAGTDPDATAFDLFLDAADDAAAGRRDSERLDAGVLEVLARAGSLFARGGTRLSVSRAGGPNVVLDPSAAVLIRALADETPQARVSRVSGILDTLTVSTRTMALRLADGSVLRGFAGAIPVDRLKHLLGAAVVLEGSVTFRPSGAALRIEVESAFPATSGDVIWARLPRDEPTTLRARPSSSSPNLDEFFGSWPGDETDDELAAALRELS